MTLARVKEELEALGLAVDVMTVCWDALSRIQPEYGMRLNPGERYIFPWERTALHPTNAERMHADSDLSGWRVAFDMDGVLLPDLDDALYEQDVDAALSARDALAPLPVHPFWQNGHIIGSARLEIDRART